jgi:hypothetical protein
MIKIKLSSHEQGILILGLVLGALLGYLGNFSVNSYFRLSEISKDVNITILVFFLSTIGFWIVLIWMISWIKKSRNR